MKNTNNTTELVFILDRSSSTAGLGANTIGEAIHYIYAHSDDESEQTLMRFETAGKFGIGAGRAVN